VSQSTINLAKNIVGAGMLSMPAGVAAFSGSPYAVMPAVLLTLVFAMSSAYAFVLLGELCQSTGENTYQGAWARLFGTGSTWLITLACLANAVIGCICYSMILGDCLSLILAPVGLPTAIAGRSASMIFLTISLLLPLCCLRSLAALARFSAVGVASNVFIVLVVLLRCFDGSYRAGGALLRQAPLAPAFTTAVSPLAMLTSPSITVLLGILGTAFLAHYNAPFYYEGLAPGPDGRKGGRFLAMSVAGFALAAVLMSLVMVGGFLTFGSSCSGLILNSYAARDGLAAAARGAIGVSLITAYPIVFFSVKSQVLGMLPEDLAEKATKGANYSAVTALLLGLVTSVALKLTDLGKVAGFAGAIFGISLIYVAPPLMALRARQKGMAGFTTKGLRRIAEVATQIALIPMGVLLGVVGAVQILT
jgi:amino acid permease